MDCWRVGILALLGVQAALFSPAKYGILPEILPHSRTLGRERLSGDGLEPGDPQRDRRRGAILSAANSMATGPDPSQSPIWLGGVLLTVLSACGLGAALAIPRVAPARAAGGMVTTMRIAWESIRADRVLRLTLIGQILVWAIASLVPAPILPYASKVLHLAEWQTGLPLVALGIGIAVGCVLAGKISGPKVEYGLLPLGALGLTVCTLLFAVIGPGMVGTMIIMAMLGIFSGMLFVPLNALLQWRAPADRRGAVIAFANVLVYFGMLMGSVLAARAGQVRGRPSRDVPGGLDHPHGLLRLGDDAGPRGLLPIHPAGPGPYAVSRAGPGPVERAERRRGPAGAQPRVVRRRPLPVRQHCTGRSGS